MTEERFNILYNSAINNEESDWISFLQMIPRNKKELVEVIISKLYTALEINDSDQIELLVKVALIDGADERYIDVLSSIMKDAWVSITSHEDIIDLLIDINSDKTVPVLIYSLNKEKEYDPFFSFKKKVVLALKKTGTSSALKSLQYVQENDDTPKELSDFIEDELS